MNPEDYPAIYIDADSASLTAQSKFFKALSASLVLLIASAALSLIGHPASWFAAVQALALLGSLAVSIYLASSALQRVWYGTRAIAESVKTVAWRYAMRAEPFNGNQYASRTDFIQALQGILSDNEASKHIVAFAEAGQISAKMEELRKSSLAERKSFYAQHRIDDQRKWYRNKAKANDCSTKRWVRLLIAAHIVAILSAMARVVWPEVSYWPTDVFVASAAAAIAWLNTKRFQELAASYSLAAHEIGFLRAKLHDITTKHGFSDFVGDAENAFSREHTQWRARLDKD